MVMSTMMRIHLPRWALLIFGAWLCLALAGCAAATPTAAPATATIAPAPATPVPPTFTPVPPTPTTIPPTATALPATAVTAPASPTAVPVANTDSSKCVACHTNAETLKGLAKEPEKKESLSEGEG